MYQNFTGNKMPIMNFVRLIKEYNFKNIPLKFVLHINFSKTIH